MATSTNKSYFEELKQASKKATDEAVEKINSATDARLTKTEERVSTGFIKQAANINRNTDKVLARVDSAEAKLSRKIDSIGGLSLGSWLIVVIMTFIGGIAGWLFSKSMITHQFACWVDRVETTQYVRDAYGNIVDVVQNTTVSTVWPAVFWTIGLSAVLFGFAALALCAAVRSSSKEEQDDEKDSN